MNSEILIRNFLKNDFFLWMRRIFQIRNWQRCLRHQCMTRLNGNYRHQYIQWIHEKTTKAKKINMRRFTSIFQRCTAHKIDRLFVSPTKLVQNISKSIVLIQNPSKSEFLVENLSEIYLFNKKAWICSKPQKKSVFKTSCIQGV